MAQAETKLETAIEANPVDSVGKEKVFNCVRDLRDEVVDMKHEANKAVEKKVILVAKELEMEKRENNCFSLALWKMKLRLTRMKLMKL